MVIILLFKMFHSDENENYSAISNNDVIYGNIRAAAKHSEGKLRDKQV
jgi:hypothetical protein